MTRRFTSFSSLSPSLAKIELVCFSTARSDTATAAAIAALFLPCAISARICVSRAVSVSRLDAFGCERDFTSSSTTSGSITEPPLATARMARTRSSTLATRSLSR